MINNLSIVLLFCLIQNTSFAEEVSNDKELEKSSSAGNRSDEKSDITILKNDVNAEKSLSVIREIATVIKGKSTHASRARALASKGIRKINYIPVKDLDKKLSIQWTKNKYIEAYKLDYEKRGFKNELSKRKRIKWGIGRFTWAYIEPVAWLYQTTQEQKYLDTVRDYLLYEAEKPSGDRQFTLSRTANCYALVKAGLSADDRKILDAHFASEANKCLKMENGTAMNRGVMNVLGIARVANLLPDHPDHATWQAFHQSNWLKGLLRIKDSNEDCMSYNNLWLYNVMLYVEETEIDAQQFYAQPWVKEIFERTLNIRMPVGTEPEMIGLNLSVQSPVILEWAGKIYQDGRYRWAAQRSINLFKSQNNNQDKMPREPVFVYVDDAVKVVEPKSTSYYAHRRYDREFPNKLALRSGYDKNATGLFVNLLNAGGHGAADGSAIYAIMDKNALLLAASNRYSPSEEYQNLVLIKRENDTFPNGRIRTSNGQWRRTFVNPHAGTTAAGGLNVDLNKVTSMGLRIESKNSGIITIKDVNIISNNGTTTKLSDKSVSYQMPNKWSKLPQDKPINLDDCKGVEFTWKYDGEGTMPSAQFYLNSRMGTSRFGSFVLDSWRESKVRFFGDFKNVHLASLEVDVYDYMGSNHKQFRDIIMLPNKLIWVRDSFIFGGDNSLQIGPTWHARDVADSGKDWFQTSTLAIVSRDGTFVNAGEKRSLLIVLPEHDGIKTSAVKNNTNRSGRPYTIYQNFQGDTNKGSRIAFDSFLIPNDGKIDPKTTAAGIKILHEDNDSAVARYGQWILVDNPSGTTIQAAGVKTDYTMLAIELDANDNVVYAAGLNGLSCFYKNLGIKVDEIGENE